MKSKSESHAEKVDRWVWVDHAKGVGIILVVYGHVARGLLNAGLPVNKGLFSMIDTIIYSFHMQLFFFLAGLFVFHSLQKRGAVSFIANKIDVIIYPYIIWSLGQGIIEVILGSYTNNHVKWVSILSLWVPRAQFWFLYSLMGMFILSAILFSLLKQERWFAYALLVMGLAIVLVPCMERVWGIKSVTQLIYFSMGCVAASNLQWGRVIGDRISLIFIAVIFLIVEFLLYSLLNPPMYLAILVKLIAACVGISLCFKIEKITGGRIRNIIIRLGRASMFIYLSHIIIGSGVRIILQKVFRVDNITLHLFLGTLTGLVIPLFILEIFGKRQWIRALLLAPDMLSLEKRTIAMSVEQ